jgi:hypothetical protein
MQPDQAYTEFRKLLKGHGRTLKSLMPPEGTSFALEFYQSFPLASPGKDADGIAYSCSIPHRRSGARFEFSLFRLFEQGSPTPSRLRLSFCYGWSDVVKWLGRPDFGLPQTNYFAWSHFDIPAFTRTLQADATYQSISDKAPRSVELRLEPIWGVFG